jgi:hypothetical protein
VQLSLETIDGIISDGGAEAINAAKSELGLIAEQINLGLQENEVEKVQYQIDLTIKATVDVKAQKTSVTGGYGAKTANLKKWGQKIEREIVHPDQPNLPYDNTEGKDGPGEE